MPYSDPSIKRARDKLRDRSVEKARNLDPDRRKKKRAEHLEKAQ